MNLQVIDISRWPFSLSESSASGGGPPRNDGSSFFSRYYLCKMLTGIILISILGKCRESFTRSSGNLPSLALPVHERACERIDARKGEGARRFDACDRRRDVRSALMPLRGSRNVRVGMAGGRTWASSSPSCDLEHEHVRQQLLRLYSEFAGEGPDSAWHIAGRTPIPRGPSYGAYMANEVQPRRLFAAQKPRNPTGKGPKREKTDLSIFST